MGVAPGVFRGPRPEWASRDSCLADRFVAHILRVDFGGDAGNHESMGVAQLQKSHGLERVGGGSDLC